MKISAKDLNPKEMHRYLLGAVAPRPIAFASTVDAEGRVNLSPFSFFNVFSSNPPILIFSPSRRGRDNTTKDSYANALAHPEVAINIVSHDMVEQMSLASTEYASEVNEFIKSGFTEEPSELIKPPRVKESKVSFECRINEVKPLGDQGGAGNLVICEVLLMHIDEGILDGQNQIDPFKMNHVGRLGANWYVHVNQESIFEVRGPVKEKGIGVDQIPEYVKNSTILTGNDLGKLGNVANLPTDEEVEFFANEPEVRAILDSFDDDELIVLELHKLAHDLLAEGEVDTAWKTLLLHQFH
jgi:flavin reductase (DIM6/NTAB) family NADH-FMN oxidoreductase RutF